MRAVLVTSGAYVNAELAAEFGQLPPSFLPLGVRRLYEHQVEALAGEGTDLYLSLPEDFAPDRSDLDRLDAAGVRVLRVDPRTSLGRSVRGCLEQLGAYDAVEILHGDTLIRPPRPFAGDAMSVGDARDGYAWAAAEVVDGRIARIAPAPPHRSDGAHRAVLSGYFAFADPAAFLALLEDLDFVEALDAYLAGRRVVPVADEGWLDFGHVQTFFRSRGSMAAARAFNDLRVAKGVVTKRSAQAAKLAAEAAWFERVPPAVRVYTARLVEVHPDGGYATEYEHLPSLAELYAFGRLNRPTWSRVLDACAEYLSLAASITAADEPDDALQHLAIGKTRERLAAHASATGFALDAERRIDGERVPSVARMLDELDRVISSAPRRSATLMHGDLCFSNVLYNSRVERVRLLDPRGGVRDGVPSVFGDVRYDVAKLAHSIIGRYDLVVCGRAVATCEGTDHALVVDEDPDKDWLEHEFAGLVVGGDRCGSDVTWATTITLFLSMLPLHADRPDRQAAFVATALRLYRRFFG